MSTYMPFRHSKPNTVLTCFTESSQEMWCCEEHQHRPHLCTLIHCHELVFCSLLMKLSATSHGDFLHNVVEFSSKRQQETPRSFLYVFHCRTRAAKIFKGMAKHRLVLLVIWKRYRV